MRAIVTGSAGFIGSHLVDRLSTDGWDVTGIDRKAGPSIQGMTELPPEVDAIFHLASPVGPVGVLSQAGYIVSEVIECADIVARWAAGYGCPLVDVSTSEVYGSGGSDSEDDVCTFRSETSARKEYAIAKLAAETMLRNRPLDLRIIRPFNVAGPRQSSEGGFVIPRFIEQARAGVPLTVYQPGSQRRAFTHVLDIVDGLVRSIGWPADVYNLGNPANSTSISALARLVFSTLGVGGTIETVNPQAIHGPHFREAPDKLPNPGKAMNLGWVPTRDLATIIRDAGQSRLSVAA
jgi:nucleoside-diphosphate-sugar epimerase